MPNPKVGFCGAIATGAVHATTCDPGYYLENGTCHDCGVGYYCTGGTANRLACIDLVPENVPQPDSYLSLSNGSWSDYNHAIKSTDCTCYWYFNDEGRETYMNQRPCEYGPGGNNYTYFYWCRTGYYATNPLGWGDWYTNCAPCDNGPAHSHYTSYSTPSVMYAVESNCPWECDDGYGRVDDRCEPLCATGITHLHVGAASVPLFPVKYTTPAIVVQTTGGVCYGNLTPGNGTGINITVNSTTYHME